MSKTITAVLQEDPETLIAKAKEKVEGTDTTFEGDAEKGWFNAMGVVGSYKIEEGEVSVKIIKKPLLIPWNMVEKTVRDFFA